MISMFGFWLYDTGSCVLAVHKVATKHDSGDWVSALYISHLYRFVQNNGIGVFGTIYA